MTATRRERLVAFSALMLVTLLAALDQTIVATALPRLSADLDGLEHLTWIVTAYLLASTVTIPLYGKLSDLFGRRRLLLLATGLFLAGSLLCAAASNVGELVTFRALQGLGAGGLLPLSQAAIGDLFSPRERGRYQGYVGSMWATAAIAGPLVGGILVDHVSWRWIFLVNLPLGAAALVAIAKTLPAAWERRAHRIDFAGAATLSIAIVGVLLAFASLGRATAWDTTAVLAPGVAGLGALAAFVVVERRAPEPLVPLALLREPVPRVTIVGALALGALVLALVVFAPLLLQGVHGRSATVSGLVVVPQSLGWVLCSFVSGQIISRTGRYRVFPIVGATLVLAGTASLAAAGASAPPPVIAAMLTVAGMGLGFTWPVYIVAMQNAVPHRLIGTTTATLLFSRTMASSVGVALLGALLNTRLASELAPLGGTADDFDLHRLSDGAAMTAAERAALGDALQSVFLATIPVGAALLVAALALPALPLRAHPPSGARDAGREAAAERLRRS